MESRTKVFAKSGFGFTNRTVLHLDLYIIASGSEGRQRVKTGRERE